MILMNEKPVLHLLCNAHLDPVWLWEWEEGACEALSTFRTAADICEENDGFVFNHNEAVLYKWVEQYEPQLFERIRNLVRAGKWHIMGGWYLQPDCNMPAGEAMVRQILVGNRFFQDKFGVKPTTAINFDPFGHSRGLVQILAKCGYDSYIHCRPSRQDCGQKADAYVWTGYDGSQVTIVRPRLWYNSPLGKAGIKLEEQLGLGTELGVELMLWGVGNHGGGPSRQDVVDLDRIIAARSDWEIRHSTPEAFFADLRRRADDLPRWESDLNPWGVGCYSSMIRVKQGYRALENNLFLTEKMAAAAAVQELMAYPVEQIREAEEDMLWTAFHDVLPGSSTAPVEQYSLQRIGHGLEILGRIRARAFHALAAGQSKAKPDTFPVLVYNPHPWAFETTVTDEFNLPDSIYCRETFYVPHLIHDGVEIPIQAERPHSNVPLEWRKRVVFKARLAAGVMNRFDVTMHKMSKTPVCRPMGTSGVFNFCGKDLEWGMNLRSGLVDHLRVNGRNVLRKGAFQALVIQDTPDPWGMTTDRFDNVIGRFHLLSAARSAEISGVDVKRLEPVRVIEDGPVRTVVEALYGFNDSFLIMTWKLPKQGAEIEIEARVMWNEKDKMLKLAVPSSMRAPSLVGEVIYGCDKLPTDGREVVAQKWLALVSKQDDLAMSVINNGTYAASYAGGQLRLTLLRSPAYSAHPIADRPTLPDDCFRPRIDQGERVFSFWLNAGTAAERLDSVAREAQTLNEKPFAQWLSPVGDGSKTPDPFIVLSNDAIQMTSARSADNGDGWIIRLFEPTGHHKTTQLTVAIGTGITRTISFNPFEIKTFRIDPGLRDLIETDLRGEILSRAEI